jgi:mono/diheme cytochrome c family protein
MKNVSIIAIIVAITFLTLPGYADDLLNGRSVYMRYCAECHGEFGKGDGPKLKIKEFKQKPKDLKGMKKISSEKIERAVVLGVEGVEEHTFGNLLTHEEVRDVIKYVKSLNR